MRSRISKTALFVILTAFVAFACGCDSGPVPHSGPVRSQPHSDDNAPVANRLSNHIVEAACGQCQFGMEGDGCDLAIRVDGKTYFVDGTGIDDHGDAHGDNGLCNCVRKATVTGEIKDGRFATSQLELQSEMTPLNGSPH